MAKSPKEGGRVKSKPQSGRRKPPEVMAALLCDAVSFDPNTRKTTIYGIFDRIAVRDAEQPTTVTLFVKFRSEAGNHQLTVELIDHRGKVLRSIATTEGEFAAPTTEAFFRIGDVKFPKPGAYAFRISINGNALAPAAHFHAIFPEAQQ